RKAISTRVRKGPRRCSSAPWTPSSTRRCEPAWRDGWIDARLGSGAGRWPMSRRTAHDYDQELLALFDAYVHGDIDRRRFLERAAQFAAAGVTAAMLLDELSPVFAAVVPPDDKRLVTSRVEIRSPAGYGTLRAYQAF